MMDLRAEHKWDSRKMRKNEWADAVQLFSKTRQEKEPSRALVPIQGKIFQDEFPKVEKTISQRLQTNNFEGPFNCGSLQILSYIELTPPIAKSGNETFWRKHCYAVPGFGPQRPDSFVNEGQAGSSEGAAGPSDVKGKGKVC